jgi:hypothetical protein
MLMCPAGLTVADANMTAADQVGLFFAQPLSGHATLVMQYSYSLVQKDTGFHLDPYTAADGTQYMYAATHMEVRRFFFFCFWGIFSHCMGHHAAAPQQPESLFWHLHDILADSHPAAVMCGLGSTEGILSSKRSSDPVPMHA